MGDEHKDSQQEPTQDSGLQTPQPDQPMPKEEERRDDLAEESEPMTVEEERRDDLAEESPPVNADNPAAPADPDES